MVTTEIFPHILVRLPIVPRSALHALGYGQTLAALRVSSQVTGAEAFVPEDSEISDAAAIRLLQWPPFLDALTLANPELARRVAALTPTPTALLKKKSRQTLRAALRYLWRAALRPVPHGLLCGTAAGTMEAQWSEPPPDLSRRIPARTVAPSRVAEIARMAWQFAGAAAKSRIYLSPTVWSGSDGRLRYWDSEGETAQEVPCLMLPLVEVVSREPGLRFSEVRERAGDDTISSALQRGLIERYAAAPNEDEAQALYTLLWEATLEDLRLLEPLSMLSDLFEQGEHRRTYRACVDSCYGPSLGLAKVPGMRNFLHEIADLGTRVAEPVSLTARIVATILRRMYPPDQSVPLLEIYSECKRMAASCGMDFRGPELWERLAEVLGIEGDGTGCACCIQTGGDPGMVDFPMPRVWTAAAHEPRRIAVLFRRARSGRFFLAHFGDGRMSLLPRYARLPFDANRQFRTDAEEWLNRWPEVLELYGGSIHDADVHDLLGRNAVRFSGAVPREGSIPLGSLKVKCLPDDHAPVIEDASGRLIHTAFWGVTAYHNLPEPVRFALALGNPTITVLERVCETVVSMIAAGLIRTQDAVLNLPAVTWGATVLLSPRIWLVPASALPNVAAPVGARGFVSFHEWLLKKGMPSRLVQVIKRGSEPHWLDLGHPEGVNNFLRVFRSANKAIVSESFLGADEDGLSSVQGWYEPEYYAEVAVVRKN